MLKYLLLLSLLTYALFAQKIDKVEIYASKMESKSNRVKASGGVSVIYQDYLLSAQRATYDRNTGNLELFEHIQVNYKGKSKVLGDYARVNIENKEKLFRPFYMLDNKSKVWISADEGSALDRDFTIKSGSLSGCNPMDPLWSMDFSSSDYNAKNKWMNVYNMRLYMGDIPLFYTPYFGYSLDKTRRTGLLFPSLGISDAEGVFYAQSLYIAEQNWWDLELIPQVRTRRGAGIYSTFRFIDSAKSHGELKLGYFKERNSYFEEYNLQNNSHYGYNFLYDNQDFINHWFGTKLQGQSGIYVDIKHMNDVDYINLASNNRIETSTATQVLSRVNMFYNTDQHYVGAYFKYYQDLQKTSNEDTLQKLPTLQYHYYLDTLLQNHLIYSLDIKSHNIQRQVDKTAVQTNINIPINLQTNLFDEYINVAYRANLYAQHSMFGGTQDVPQVGVEYNNGYIARNSHQFSLNTQLTKGYEDYTHVVGLGVSYTNNGSEIRNGYYEDYKDKCSDPANSAAPECEFYNISEIQEETQLDFIQYIYDSSAKEIVYHRLSQSISNSRANDKYGELENELNYKINSYFSFYNNMFYNFDQKRFSKVLNKITYHSKELELSASHLYKDSFIDPLSSDDPDRYTSYLTSGLKYKYNKHYSFNTKYDYDVELSQRKAMEFGFMYKQRCWDFGIKYAENNRPILTQAAQSDSIYDRYVYITVLLKPFMHARGDSSMFAYKLAN
jgi:LPS-assembly protein